MCQLELNFEEDINQVRFDRQNRRIERLISFHRKGSFYTPFTDNLTLNEISFISRSNRQKWLRMKSIMDREFKKLSALYDLVKGK